MFSPSSSLEVRMGESLAKSGASVSVTSITDVLCFGVGVISNMPVVRLFCVYTSIALAIDFFYQVHVFNDLIRNKSLCLDHFLYGYCCILWKETNLVR